MSDIYGMFILQTVPEPTLPSKVKKLAMGGSRPAKALRMSCARNPPMMAQTGENSCIAVVERDLEKYERMIMAGMHKAYSKSSLGTLVMACLFTSASAKRELAVVSSSAVHAVSLGSSPL